MSVLGPLGNTHCRVLNTTSSYQDSSGITAGESVLLERGQAGNEQPTPAHYVPTGKSTPGSLVQLWGRSAPVVSCGR